MWSIRILWLGSSGGIAASRRGRWPARLPSGPGRSGAPIHQPDGQAVGPAEESGAQLLSHWLCGLRHRPRLAGQELPAGIRDKPEHLRRWRGPSDPDLLADLVCPAQDVPSVPGAALRGSSPQAPGLPPSGSRSPRPCPGVTPGPSAQRPPRSLAVAAAPTCSPGFSHGGQPRAQKSARASSANLGSRPHPPSSSEMSASGSAALPGARSWGSSWLAAS